LQVDSVDFFLPLTLGGVFVFACVFACFLAFGGAFVALSALGAGLGFASLIKTAVWSVTFVAAFKSEKFSIASALVSASIVCSCHK
jgi:hypothetical protein